MSVNCPWPVRHPMEGLAMSVTRRAASLWGALWQLGLVLAVCESFVGGQARAGNEPEKPDRVAVGYEIFNREWLPNDARGHGGDGLGPVYNDTSCVACHNSGGSGGAGPVSKNIDILTASRNLASFINAPAPAPASTNTQPAAPAGRPAVSPSSLLDALTEFHAGFRTSRNVVLHKFGTDPNYDSWRRGALSPGVPNGPQPNNTVPRAFPAIPPTAELSAENLAATKTRLAEMQGKLAVMKERLAKSINGKPDARKGRSGDDSSDIVAAAKIQEIQASISMANAGFPNNSFLTHGQFLVTRSQRNPTPLFGLGLIDAIPANAIEAMAKHQAKESPETRGRVSHVKDGRVGRLGWKGQVASVEDFVLNACAVELGLEVPGHHQALIPQAPKYRASGLDLTTEECSSLVAYVKSLPRPDERQPFGDDEAKVQEAGRATFASIGCAACHSPTVGDVRGIYSDLLLHDMGPELSDDGSYDDSSGDDGPLVPDVPPDFTATGRSPLDGAPPRGAMRSEWRTPPLWGFRDSGPYLHDGRAQTLEQAVAMHGGQGTASARKFFELSPRERLQVEALLKSLVAPPSSQLASR
jgi:CxxC motif-containing protein (DUF1111 family)